MFVETKVVHCSQKNFFYWKYFDLWLKSVWSPREPVFPSQSSWTGLIRALCRWFLELILQNQILITFKRLLSAFKPAFQFSSSTRLKTIVHKIKAKVCKVDLTWNNYTSSNNMSRRDYQNIFLCVCRLTQQQRLNQWRVFGVELSFCLTNGR